MKKLILVLVLVIMVGCAEATQPVVPSSTSEVIPKFTPTVRISDSPPDVIRESSPDYIADKLGVELGSVGERALEFVDVAKTLRRWENIDADTCPDGDDACRYAPLDDGGYPTTDARTVFFDKRPFGAWW